MKHTDFMSLASGAAYGALALFIAYVLIQGFKNVCL